MPVTTGSPKAKTRGSRAARKVAATTGKTRAAKAATKAAAPRRAVRPVDDRAVRRAVGAVMFDPVAFVELYGQGAEQREAHWAEVRRAPTPAKPAKAG